MARRWLPDRRRLTAVVLVALAGFQVWTGYHALSRHPVLGWANLIMAAVLLLGVILTW